jgi:Tfp pilus assembly protein PilV
MKRRQMGLTLIELLISLLMSLVVAAGLFSIFTNTFAMHDAVVSQGSAETSARTPLDDVADHLRDAQQYWTTGAVTPTLVTQSSVIANATTTSVTYYRSNLSSDTVRYWLNGTNLTRTAGGTDTVLMGGVKTLTFTYWKAPNANGNYNNSSATKIIGNPVAAELPFLNQITIDASVTVDGYSRELVSLVRLRNSPYKVHL